MKLTSDTHSAPQLTIPAPITPDALRAAAALILWRWPSAPHTAVFPGWAYADLMTAAAIIEAAAGALEAQAATVRG